MNRDSVTITIPKKGARLYFFKFGSSRFPHIVAHPDDVTTYTVKSTVFHQLGYLDQFGNKGVEHYGVRGSISLAYLSSNVTSSIELYSSRSLLTYRNGEFSELCYAPGTGPVYGSWIVDLCTETRHESSYTRSTGERWFTRVDKLVSLDIDYSKLTATCVCSVQYESDDPSEVQGPHIEVDQTYLRPFGRSAGVEESTLFMIKANIFSLVPDRESIPSAVIPTDLAADFIDSQAIPNINNIENFKDLKELSKMVPPIINLIKKRNIKSLADFYLWYKYTYKTTELDVREAIRALSKHFGQKPGYQKWSRRYKNRDKGTDWPVYHTRYTVYYDTFTQGFFESCGLKLNCSNLWDIIPFSFVADWFINLGDIFTQLDACDRAYSVPIRSVLYTTKGSKQVTLEAIGLPLSLCTLEVFFFKRSQRDTLPINPLSVSLKNPFNHMLDGAALIVATKQH